MLRWSRPISSARAAPASVTEAVAQPGPRHGGRHLAEEGQRRAPAPRRGSGCAGSDRLRRGRPAHRGRRAARRGSARPRRAGRPSRGRGCPRSTRTGQRDVGQLRAGVGGVRPGHGLQCLHPARLAHLGLDARAARRPSRRAWSGIARSRYFVQLDRLPSQHRPQQAQGTGAVALDPQQGAERDRLLAGERRQLDEAGDQVGRGGGGDGRGAAADRLADDHGRATEVADEGDQVAGDVGAAVAVPAEARVTAAPDVDVGDPVAGGDQRRGDEAVGVPAVADAVGEDDQRVPRRSGRRRWCSRRSQLLGA